MKPVQIRDLTVFMIDDNQYIGVSCDSCGAIGEKEYDMVKTTPEIAGRGTAKVVLAELLSLGFKPFVLSDGLAVEMEPTGRRIINGIKETLSLLKSCEVQLTGSTEENMKTVQTSMGITGVGVCDKDNLRYKKTSRGDLCVLAGLPLVGNDVLNNPDKVLEIDDYESFYLSSYVKEFVPVGSKGIFHEIAEIEKPNNLFLDLSSSLEVDLLTSGGPSTSCVMSVAPSDLDKVKALTTKPIHVLGRFK